MTVRVLGRRVLVKPLKHAEKIGLIVVPERSKQRPQEGIIEVVGDQVTTLKPGERVLFGRYAGVTVGSGDEMKLLLWDRDVIAVLEG